MKFTAVNDWTRNPAHKLFRPNVPSNALPGSVMKMLKQEELEYPNCQEISRIQMCYDEYDAEGIQPLMDFGPGFHLRDMLTQNFLVADGQRSAKTMVNVGGLPNDYVKNLNLLKDGNVHEPAPGYCKAVKAEGWEVQRNDALFVALHFPGSKTQRFSRVNDLRGNTPWVCGQMRVKDCCSTFFVLPCLALAHASCDFLNSSSLEIWNKKTEQELSKYHRK